MSGAKGARSHSSRSCGMLGSNATLFSLCKYYIKYIFTIIGNVNRSKLFHIYILIVYKVVLLLIYFLYGSEFFSNNFIKNDERELLIIIEKT